MNLGVIVLFFSCPGAATGEATINSGLLRDVSIKSERKQGEFTPKFIRFYDIFSGLKMIYSSDELKY